MDVFGNETKIIFFLLNSEFKERGCSSFRTQSNSFETFELNSVVDAKPFGYKLYFQLSVIPKQTARILLKSARVSSLALDYRIGMIDTVSIVSILNDSLTYCIDFK